MPLLTPNAPNACLAAFSDGLSAFLPGGPPGTVVSEKFVGATPFIPSSADVRTSGGQPNITAVIRTFVLSLTDAANNTGQISPNPAGWSIFAGDANDRTVVGRMVQQGQTWKLVAVQYGDIVWQTMSASRQLNTAPPVPVQIKDYELRLLLIPGLNLQVFWLAAQDPLLPDLVFQTPAGVTPVPPMGTLPAPMEMPHFLADIRPRAASLLTLRGGYGA
jgi:hypothetical protein